MRFQLTDSNFLVYAAKNYESVCLDSMEFTEDLNRIKFIKKLLYRYRKTGKINERLVINHLVILYNVFNTKACTQLLTFKLYKYLEELFAFLKFMGYLPEKIEGIGDDTIITSTIKIDLALYDTLKKV